MGKRAAEPERAGSPLLILVYICAVLALAAPLFPTIAMSIPVTFTQASIFQMMVEIMFGVWLALAIVDRRYRPRLGAVMALVILFIGVIALTVPLSYDPAFSFWSRTWRMTGVWFYLHCFAWFLVLSSTLRRKEDWRAILGVSCGVTALMCGWGILRWIGDPAKQNIGSTLGNPSFLSAVLVAHLFIVGYLLVRSRGGARKLLWVCLSLFLLTLPFSASRGAVLTVLAFVVPVGVGLVLLSDWPRRRKVTVVTVCTVAVVGSIGGALLLRSPALSGWGQANLPNFAKRLVYRNFGNDRWLLWSYAARGIAERPLLGWGNEGFVHLYDRYQDPEASSIQVFNERWQDRAHNQHLDILVSFGALGFVPYLLLWLGVLAMLVRRTFRGDGIEDRRESFMLAAFFASYLLYVTFMFDTPAHAAVMFMMLGMAGTHLLRRRDEDESELVPAGVSGLGATAFVVLLPATTAFVICASVLPLVRAKQFDESFQNFYKDPVKTARTYEKAFSWPSPYRHDFRYGAVYSLRNMEQVPFSLKPELETVFRTAVEGCEESWAVHPVGSREALCRSTALRLLSRMDSSRLGDARAAAEALRDLVPGRFDGYFELAEIDIIEGDYESAVRNLDLARERIYRSRPDLRSDVAHRQACVYADMRDFESLASVAVDLRPGNDWRLLKVLAENVTDGDVQDQEVLKYVWKVTERYQNIPAVLLAAARIFHASGETELTRTALVQAIKLGGTSATQARALKAELGI